MSSVWSKSGMIPWGIWSIQLKMINILKKKKKKIQIEMYLI